MPPCFFLPLMPQSLFLLMRITNHSHSKGGQVLQGQCLTAKGKMRATETPSAWGRGPYKILNTGAKMVLE